MLVLPCQTIAHPPGDLECRRPITVPHIIVHTPLEKAGEVVLLHVGTFGRYGYPGIRPPAIRVTILALKAADHLLIGETCLCIQVHVGNEVILVPGTVRHDIDLVHAVL